MGQIKWQTDAKVAPGKPVVPHSEAGLKRKLAVIEKTDNLHKTAADKMTMTSINVQK